MESQLGKKESGASEFPFSFLKKMGGPYLPLRLPVTHTADLRDPNGTFLQQLNITGKGQQEWCFPILFTGTPWFLWVLSNGDAGFEFKQNWLSSASLQGLMGFRRFSLFLCASGFTCRPLFVQPCSRAPTVVK